MIFKYFPLVLLIFLISVIQFLPITLFALNANYPFISKKALRILFLLYPYILLFSVIIFFINREKAYLVIFLLVTLILFYLIKLIIGTDCSECSAKGFIPYFSVNNQLIFFSISDIILFIEILRVKTKSCK